MDIKKTALAGTLESSDIQITLSQGNNGINIDLDSSVEELYGNQIRKVITDTLTASSGDPKGTSAFSIDTTAKDNLNVTVSGTSVKFALEWGTF